LLISLFYRIFLILLPLHFAKSKQIQIEPILHELTTLKLIVAQGN
jgi:hypothetical protein